MPKTKWQTIDTAPKIGFILGYDCRMEEYYAMEWFGTSWRVDGVGGYDYYYDISPTHWIPLPKPPLGSY